MVIYIFTISLFWTQAACVNRVKDVSPINTSILDGNQRIHPNEDSAYRAEITEADKTNEVHADMGYEPHTVVEDNSMNSKNADTSQETMEESKPSVDSSAGNEKIDESKKVVVFGIDEEINPAANTGTVESAKEDDVDNSIEEEEDDSTVLLNSDHSTWQELLTKYVDDSGVVNYRGIKADELLLDNYLKSLSDTVIDKKDKSPEAMATWVNAYNAFTVKLIVNNYPLSSITKIKDGKVWDHAWINMAGEVLTLNEIEHKILRTNWDDARIHFAVNCAAISCPPLSNIAFTAQNLEKELDRLTGVFINNPDFNQIKSNRVRLSKIFEWYAEDFGDLIDFVNKYSFTKANPNSTVEFNEYNWQLNGK